MRHSVVLQHFRRNILSLGTDHTPPYLNLFHLPKEKDESARRTFTGQEKQHFGMIFLFWAHRVPFLKGKLKQHF